LGNQTSEYQDREPKGERLPGEKRIRQLKAHLDHSARVLEVLQQK
jgi:hypothetical protein